MHGLWETKWWDLPTFVFTVYIPLISPGGLEQLVCQTSPCVFEKVVTIKCSSQVIWASLCKLVDTGILPIVQACMP